MWNTTDKFIQGIPDTCLTFNGISIGWEAKYVYALPARNTSKVLKHVVSGPQLTFLTNNVLAGGVGVVVVGSEDDALFLTTNSIDPKTGNLTKAELNRAVAATAVIPRVRKIKDVWQLEGILEQMLRMRGQL